ncbi:hypothetical protein Raf01_09850 [Rugosimonospora africana]|uniref:Uncharacterized protein n=1 Tax=Rugosimonospora africana TaxID=556532 RepID=A0A8J3QKU4_9ACTN|nr:hypothetical protein Raf01_09850 [Rugosimonospora africana]
MDLLNSDTPVIEIMADYDSFPVWRSDPQGFANVDPQELPIRAELARELLHWAQAYDGSLNRDDLAASGFPDRETERAFYVAGEDLARRLAVELGHPVQYFDGRRHREVGHGEPVS